MAPRTRTVREQVTQQIRDDLVAGLFGNGRPLREAELAARFGVSRGPVRDAFLQLTQEGLLAYQANRGVTVREPPKPESRQLIVSLRQQIETFLVRKGFSRITDADHERWAEILERLRAACHDGDLAAVARCDIQFHQAILESSGGEDFVPIWKWLCSRMLLAYSRLEDYMEVYQEHVAILEGFRARDKNAVVKALKDNIR